MIKPWVESYLEANTLFSSLTCVQYYTCLYNQTIFCTCILLSNCIEMYFEYCIVTTVIKLLYHADDWMILYHMNPGLTNRRDKVEQQVTETQDRRMWRKTV